MPAYRNSSDHLFEELRRLDLMLNRQIIRLRSDAGASSFNEFRGLFIGEDEIDQLFAESELSDSERDKELEFRLQATTGAIAEMERKIAANVAAARAAGVQLSLTRLAVLFDLSTFDLDALLICLAPELDVKYEKLYAYLQNDVTRKRPTADLILNLCCLSRDEKLQARTRLLTDAPLVKHGLILAVSDPAMPASFISRALRIDERILNFLLGVETIDERLAAFAHLRDPVVELANVVLPDEMMTELTDRFFRRLELERRGTARRNGIFLLHGPEGSGKQLVIEALSRVADKALLVADGRGRLAEPAAVALLFREAKLRDAVLFIDRADLLANDGDQQRYANQAIKNALASFDGLTVLAGREAWIPPWLDADSDQARFTFSLPGVAMRKEIWQRALGEDLRAESVDLGTLAAGFNFTPAKIHAAVIEARRLAGRNGDHSRPIDTEDLHRACRAQIGSQLPALARKINPIFTWDDIVLPRDSVAQLREVCNHVRHRQLVFNQWGFERKISLGKGLGILFVGPSGTGKTMAAEIVAGELGLELYKIDLSCIVSKYIGETEKNLSRVFAEAEAGNAALFFDEADAIFGKRSEVRDSHDRYANIEINYLLQKIEEYEGTVILASNFQKNIDDAFIRRLRFIIEFPFPEEDYRGRMWRKVFPAATPLAPDVDFDFLARKLKVAGGNIRNIALHAAFLAAANSGHVSMEHIVCAARREFHKMGRLCVKSDFDQYFELIEQEEMVV